ncbi:hypothetical protein M3194_25115 [Paenibacillus glycanilyticus]|uniref:hypothetical protein n=1 Tax=Paenibacillus glycanilyticus TaxID=126569 RepID=UPI0020419385|nr:hypothetical protein [Paenibacillus glycanilyticus]MCM3630616.1 hypothetical protein [Paenibacillus glycanilyticus]
MKRAKRLMRVIVYAVLITIVGVAAAAGIWYRHTAPLVNDGVSTISTPEGELLEYVVDLQNQGFRKIDLVSVTIGGPPDPGPVQLGITYDSGQIVQVLPEPVPAIEYMGIHDSSIYPALSDAEFRKAVAMKTHTPIHYGIRFAANRGPIHSVTVKYKYLGFTKKLTITNWFDH